MLPILISVSVAPASYFFTSCAETESIRPNATSVMAIIVTRFFIVTPYLTSPDTLETAVCSARVPQGANFIIALLQIDDGFRPKNGSYGVHYFDRYRSRRAFLSTLPSAVVRRLSTK